MPAASVTFSFVNGTTADADDVNTNFDDLVAFVNTNAIQKDGSLAFTANQPMGDFYFTGLGVPAADNDSARRKDGDVGIFTFSQGGELEVGAGTFRMYLPYNIIIIEVEAAVGVAPTGAAVIVDVNVSGTTIFTTQSNRPEIAVSTFVDPSTTIEDASHADGQYITVDVDQIGSVLPGENLVVNVRYRRT